jgi:hypothetical protein
MNFLHTKLRNRMTIETSDKLLFIYINSRSLRKAGSPLDKYQKKGQKELSKAIAKELNDQLLNWEDDMVTLEVDEEDDLNWAFIDNLLTDPNLLQFHPDPMDEDIAFPDITFTVEELAEVNAYWVENQGALNFDEDIYDA